jgi:hypothetical protein
MPLAFFKRNYTDSEKHFFISETLKRGVIKRMLAGIQKDLSALQIPGESGMHDGGLKIYHGMNL